MMPSESMLLYQSLSNRVCPPYTAVVRVLDVMARYKRGALYQCVVVFAARGTSVNEHITLGIQ